MTKRIRQSQKWEGVKGCTFFNLEIIFESSGHYEPKTWDHPEEFEDERVVISAWADGVQLSDELAQKLGEELRHTIDADNLDEAAAAYPKSDAVKSLKTTAQIKAAAERSRK